MNRTLHTDRGIDVVMARRIRRDCVARDRRAFDLRDRFHFVSNLTIRGKLAIAEAGGVEVASSASVDAAGG